MIDVAARHGYGDASVARVIEHAGISRATFYEHFRNREECFLAAYRALAGRAVRGLERAETVPAAKRPRAVLTEILTAAERHPSAARVLTIEALGAGSAARAERERLLGRIEVAIGRYLDDLPPGAPRLQIPARALIGGVESVIAVRIFRGGATRLGGLLFDLLDWVESYSLPPGQAPIGLRAWEGLGAGLRLPDEPSAVEPPQIRRLPRGRSALPGPSVQADQRRRILAAVVELSASRGYAATTVADLVAGAGVSREAFYGQFRGKEDAFNAAQTAALQGAISRAAEAFFGAHDWPRRVWCGLEALFAYTAHNPDLAYLDVVDSHAVGDTAIARSFDNRLAFNLFLEEGRRRPRRSRRLPELCSEAIGGAILELMRAPILAGRTEHVFTVLPQAVYVALAPFVGTTDSLEFVRVTVGTQNTQDGIVIPN
jgi:AcrR family transcriptional regulator